MNHQKVNRFIAAGVLFATLLVYVVTLAPTVVFWDVGEFIAAAKMLQVPHPPGSPLFLLVTRVAMMIPFAADMAVRAHILSAIFSALSVMFLYLVIVRVILHFRSRPASVIDGLTVYGPAVVGALALAFSTSFWGNAIEAEVYGSSMFFLTAIMWLIMVWLEKPEAPGNEKYFLLIAYLLGLSLGVHLLALLAIFPVLMIVYFTKYEYSWSTAWKAIGLAVVAFFVVYPGIVKYLPGMMDGDFTFFDTEFRGNTIISLIPWAVILAAAYFAYTTYVERKKVQHVVLMSLLLILLGYTTYTQVLIRSNANPPMNENNPNNLTRLTSYLAREQYGQQGQWPRRYSQEAHQQGIYSEYSGEWDYLLRYQMNHMFIRYLGWNFIGSEGDFQDAKVSWKDTFGLPFFIGLLGLYSLFKRDWKMGSVFLAMFLILGPALALYQNQQEPQPRERDYFYVGAFYVWGLWIALGVHALIGYVTKWMKREEPLPWAVGGIVGLALLLIPVRLLALNWEEKDRTGNYVAWDYSYNILQSCEQDAILFTNGDNDTFPLWYLQDVEGIRRDVRIVNLSLVNTSWYIKQMKDSAYYPEAKPVPISLSDEAIETIAPTAWRTRDVTLPVTDEAIRTYGVTDTATLRQKAITFTFRNTLTITNVPVIRVQDILVRDIVFTNQWRRPIYFAVTVSPDSKIGLDDYLWFHGLAWRLEPRRISREDLGIDGPILKANLLHEATEASPTPAYGYRFRGIADPGVYFDENTSRLMVNYRSAFMRLALHQSTVERDTAGAVATLDRMEALIPRAKIPMAWELESDLATLYYRLGRRDSFNAIADGLEKRMEEMIAQGQADPTSPYNPYRVLFSIHELRQDWPKMLDLLNRLAVMYPNDPGLRARINEVQQLVGRAPSAPLDTVKRGG